MLDILQILHQTCSYCRAFNHYIEECPHIIAKWKAKVTGNQNQLPNANQNVREILTDP